MTARRSIPAAKISVAVIMLFQVSALFIRELVRLKLTQAGTPPRIAQDQSAWFGFLALVILMWPYWRQHRSFVARGFRRPSSWTRLILISVAIGVSTRAASWGVTFVQASLPASYLQGGWLSVETGFRWHCPDAGPLALAMATMVIATPLIEEIINRGYILDALVRKLAHLPVLTSACLFAVLHRPDGMLVAFLFGIVVAVQMLHCQSLWGPVIAHSTFNFLFILEGYCLSHPGGEAVLLALPANQLAALGVAVGIFSFLLAMRLARWNGAATP